jgi:hypothetical protein
MKSILSLNEARDEEIEFDGLSNGKSYSVHAEVMDVDQNKSSTNKDEVPFETKKCIQPGEQSLMAIFISIFIWTCAS